MDTPSQDAVTNLADPAFCAWLRETLGPEPVDPDAEDYEAAKLHEEYSDPWKAREVQLAHNYHLAQASKLMRLYRQWRVDRSRPGG
jgi:hypothetical protein